MKATAPKFKPYLPRQWSERAVYIPGPKVKQDPEAYELHWTEEEEAYLIDACERRLCYNSVTKKLQRSKFAVRRKMQRLQISGLVSAGTYGKNRPRRPTWSDQKIERLKLLCKDKYSYEEMASMLGVSRGSISTAVRKYVKGIPDPRYTKRIAASKL